MQESIDSTTLCSPSTRRTVLSRLLCGVAGVFGLGRAVRAADDRRAPPQSRQPPQFAPPPPLVDLTKEQLQSAWDDLADAANAQNIVRVLAAGKQTVALLAEHMKPGSAPPASTRIDQLVEGLQSDRFATRQAASVALEKIGPDA